MRTPDQMPIVSYIGIREMIPEIEFLGRVTGLALRVIRVDPPVLHVQDPHGLPVDQMAYWVRISGCTKRVEVQIFSTFLGPQVVGVDLAVLMGPQPTSSPSPTRCPADGRSQLRTTR